MIVNGKVLLRGDVDRVARHYGLVDGERTEFLTMLRECPSQAAWCQREAQRIRGEMVHPDAIGINERIKNSIEAEKTRDEKHG